MQIVRLPHTRPVGLVAGDLPVGTGIGVTGYLLRFDPRIKRRHITRHPRHGSGKTACPAEKTTTAAGGFCGWMDVRKVAHRAHILSEARERRRALSDNDAMRYLCLIHLDEQTLDALPHAERNALNAAHLDYNDELRKHGHFLSAEALDPPRTASCVRVRNGKALVTDGPFAETKEIIAGFYLIDAADINEAAKIAANLPIAQSGIGTIEVRPACQLVVDGREPRWG